MHQQAPAAGGQGWGPRCRVYVNTPHLHPEALARQIRRVWGIIYCIIARAQCCLLFPFPDFPGNLAVFIPGKSGMKKSGNPGRPGNGSLGMNSLVIVIFTKLIMIKLPRVKHDVPFLRSLH